MQNNNNDSFPEELASRWQGRRFFPFSQYLKTLFTEPVYKIGIEGGFSCPNRDGSKGTKGCIYCDNEAFRSGITSADQTVTEQLTKAIPFFKNRYNANLFLTYFQTFSNTYGPIERLRSLYYEALAQEGIVGLAISTRPDCLSNETIELLAELNKKTHLWVELGLQSANNDILQKINRGHTVQDFETACIKLKKHGINICTHIIIGLPEESEESLFESAFLLNRLHIDSVKIHQLQIIKGTKLEKLYNNGEFRCHTIEEYLDLTAQYLSRLSPTISIQRLFGFSRNDSVMAPCWGKNNVEVLAAIEKHLEVSSLWQGKFAHN